MSQADRHRRVQHVCPLCGAIRHLKPADAAKTQHCRHCHCQMIAPLGFAATAAKYGRDFAILAAAIKRRAQPSSLERQVEAALRTIPGIAWEREFPVERPEQPPYFIDFLVIIESRYIALEVDGAFAHRDAPDLERIATLSLRFDKLIVLTEADITTSTELAAHLERLLL